MVGECKKGGTFKATIAGMLGITLVGITIGALAAAIVVL